jgi:transposase InsO family protein
LNSGWGPTPLYHYHDRRAQRLCAGPGGPFTQQRYYQPFLQQGPKLFPVAIRQVVTDNGKEFLGNFDKTLQEASIKHIWTYPYTPKMNATCERFNRTLREQFIEFNELLLFEDLNLFNQRMAEYLVLYNSKRPHKSLELMTPVDYILRESKNCNMWWTIQLLALRHLRGYPDVV